MIKSYDILGLTELRDDARRVMEKTYPKSGYLTVGHRTDTSGDKKSWWQLWR